MKSTTLKIWLISLTIIFLSGCASTSPSRKPEPWVFPNRPHLEIKSHDGNVCMSTEDMKDLLETMTRRELQAMENGAVIGKSNGGDTGT